jgi:hypothetical protein
MYSLRTVLLQAKTAEFSLTGRLSASGCDGALSELESFGESECTTPRSSCRHVCHCSVVAFGTLYWP